MIHVCVYALGGCVCACVNVDTHASICVYLYGDYLFCHQNCRNQKIDRDISFLKINNSLVRLMITTKKKFFQTLETIIKQ